jgi:uncharacterized protein (UPF0254 family)
MAGKNMETNVMDERLHTHALIDMLPPEKLSAVRSLLEVMLPEAGISLAESLAQAAIEDEEITPEMAARLDRARASAERGESVPHEEILRESGLL